MLTATGKLYFSSFFTAWLEDIGLPLYRELFKAELIDAYVLHELTLVRWSVTLWPHFIYDFTEYIST